MTDIFLRPVTDTDVIYLYDPTIADAVIVIPEVIIPGIVSGGQLTIAILEQDRMDRLIAQEDEEIMLIIIAFVNSQKGLAA